MQDNAHTYIELALEYAHAGLYAEADDLLQRRRRRRSDGASTTWAGFACRQATLPAPTRPLPGARLRPTTAFPTKWSACRRSSGHGAQSSRCTGAVLPGHFWYAHRRYDEAIDCWERAAALDPAFPTVHRNLGLAYMNKRGDAARARAAYEQAFALDPTDARVLFELDQLDKKLGAAPAARLARLGAHPELVERRDDLTIEICDAAQSGWPARRSAGRCSARTFHPWEGGEGKVTGQYVVALVELAKQRLAAGDAEAAIAYLERARNFPAQPGRRQTGGRAGKPHRLLSGQRLCPTGRRPSAAECYRAASRARPSPARPCTTTTSRRN